MADETDQQLLAAYEALHPETKPAAQQAPGVMSKVGDGISHLLGIGKEDYDRQAKMSMGGRIVDNLKDGANRTAAGAYGALTGLPGGPVGAAVGGAAGYLSPPQDAKSWAGYLASAPLLHGVNKLPGKGAIAGAAKQGVGYELNRALYGAMGNDVGPGNPLSRSTPEQVMEALGMAGGAVGGAFRNTKTVQAQQKAQETLDRFNAPRQAPPGQPAPMQSPMAPGTQMNHIPAAAPDFDKTLTPEIQRLQQQTALAQKVQSATHPNQPAIDAKQKEIEVASTRLGFATNNEMEAKQQALAATVANKQVIGKLEQHNLKLAAEQKELEGQYKAATADIKAEEKASAQAAKTGKPYRSSDPDVDLDDLQAEIEQRKQQRLANEQRIVGIQSGHPSEVGNRQLINANRSIAINQAEQKRMQTVLAPLNDDLKTLKGTLNKSGPVDTALQSFASAKDPDELVTKLVQSNPEDIGKLMDTGGLSDASKAALAQQTQLKFVQMAADGKGGFGNLPQAQAALNKDKLAALYGGGLNGRVEADRHMQFFDDITAALQHKDSMGSQVFKVVKGSVPGMAVAMLFNHGSPAAIGADLAAGAVSHVLTFKIPALLEQVASSQKMSDAVHKWMAGGASLEALKTYPALYNWVVSQNTKKK